jgi:hypothetical protein
LASVAEVPVEKVSVIAVLEGFGRLPFSVGTHDGKGTPGGVGEGGRRRLNWKEGGTRARGWGGGGGQPPAAMHGRDRGNADTGMVGGGGGGGGGGDGYGWYCTVVLAVSVESDRENAVVTLLRSIEFVNNAFRAAELPQVCVVPVLSCVYTVRVCLWLVCILAKDLLVDIAVASDFLRAMCILLHTRFSSSSSTNMSTRRITATIFEGGERKSIPEQRK